MPDNGREMLIQDAVAEQSRMRTRRNEKCYLCGRDGALLYEHLSDRIGGCSGVWSIRRCLSCELLWIDPIPVESDIGRAYESYFTHEDATPRRESVARRLYQRSVRAYLDRKFGYKLSRKTIVDTALGMLLSALPSRSQYVDASVLHLHHRPQPSRMLDVGCGNGAAISYLRALGWQVEGIDFDPVVVEQAKKKGLTVHLGSLDDQRYHSESFDAVTASHVIEHVYEPVAFVRECVRILKPGGTLVLLTPNSSSWGHRKFSSSWLYLDPPRHLFLFNPVSLTEVANRAGLKISSLRTSGGTTATMHEGSAEVGRTGRFDVNRRLRSRRGWSSEMLELQGWLNRQIRPDQGEELVLIGTKS